MITNLFRAVPYVGVSFVEWLWGGFSVDNPTLDRFFVLHFLLPFLTCGFILLHIIFLHSHGSNNPLGVVSGDKVPFHPYYTIKDVVGFLILIIILHSIVLVQPFLLNEPDNFIAANPLSTPAHIVPE